MSKKNRRALRRTLLSLSMTLVVAFAAVTGTIAWLTSETELVTNTFSVGSVEITLDEAVVNEYGKLLDAAGTAEDEEGFDADNLAERYIENEYKLLPGHKYTKDPTVHVVGGSEPCWVFVKITNDIEDIISGTGKGTIEQQIIVKGWQPLDGVDGVYYKENVDARNVAEDETLDLIVFEEFTINNDADVANYDENTIEIIAYAIQADGNDTAALAWNRLFAN